MIPHLSSICKYGSLCDMEGHKKKVFVGMSGGVDSSVSALLLREAGYEVVGVFIKVWQADFLPCTWRDERREAMRAAAHLGIPFLTLDLEREYKEGVVDYMIREYARGRVPNPDVMCNKEVKFGGFLQFALAHGADFVATGHYAQTTIAGSALSGLYAGADQDKDQSYFLWTLTSDELARTLFPVGHLPKPEVRRLAELHGLPNAKKKDSQGLCFMGHVDMREFLSHYVEPIKGDVVTEDGEVIGAHDGVLFFTIGQRHGFRIHPAHQTSTPLYVVGKDMTTHRLVVAPRTPVDAGTMGPVHLTLTDTVWHDAPIRGERHVTARVRYRGHLHPALVTMNGDQGLEVTIETPQDPIALGQSLVLYDGLRVIGGGIIDAQQ